MKKVLKKIFMGLKAIFPFGFYLIQYWRAGNKIGNNIQCKEIFEEFIQNCGNKKCLQIGVKENVGKKYGTNWVSVDKFDVRDFIDFNYDIHDLPFENDSFDAVVCISILEHIPYPLKAISELRRVLKPGGRIWIQMPWLYPYHEVPKDYWRISPDGARIWMEDFKEISCGAYFFDKTSFAISTFFYGEK